MQAVLNESLIFCTKNIRIYRVFKKVFESFVLLSPSYWLQNFTPMCIDVGEGGRGARSSPAWKLSGQIWNISWQIWKYSGKPKNEDFFNDHTNPMRKKGKVFAKIFFLENTLYIWKYFVFNIRAILSADSYPPRSLTAMPIWTI